jgi:hypothetical protein
VEPTLTLTKNVRARASNTSRSNISTNSISERIKTARDVSNTISRRYSISYWNYDARSTANKAVQNYSALACGLT